MKDKSLELGIFQLWGIILTGIYNKCNMNPIPSKRPSLDKLSEVKLEEDWVSLIKRTVISNKLKLPYLLFEE